MNKLGVLEGILFLVGDDGITVNDLKEILNEEKLEIENLLELLKKRYDNPEFGIDLKHLGNTYKLTTKEKHRKYYEKLLKKEQNTELSQAALETLAIIAYNEPITRIEIDEARGVYSAQMLRKLTIKGLIEVCGKAEFPGRPNLYKTTNLFLDYFGLSSVEDLPKLEMEDITSTEERLFEVKYKEEVE